MGSIIGYYGCYCHPFTSWSELDEFDNQQIAIGDSVKHRCTGREGIIIGKAKETIYPTDGKPYEVEHTKCYVISYGLKASDTEIIMSQNAIVLKRNTTSAEATVVKEGGCDDE